MSCHSFRVLLFVVLASIAILPGDVTFGQSGSSQPTVSIRRIAALNYEVWPADFNGDGMIDLAGEDAYTTGWGTTLVALGRGDGSFGAPIRLECACSVLGVADFNGDRRQDLLVVQRSPSGYIGVLAGRGDGTFGALANVAMQAAWAYFGLAADVDGDGRQDVVLGVSDGSIDKVVVVPGNGDLTFRSQSVTVLASGTYPNDGVVTDLNGDGHNDLVIANHDGHSLAIFLNQGAFTFIPSDLPFDRQVNDVAAADVNRDGKTDLIVATSRDANDDYNYWEGDASVLVGKGDGTFAQPIVYTTAPGARQLVVGDFTRDGIPDIATANRSSSYVEDCGGSLLRTWDSVSILPGRSDGTFGAASSFSLHDQRVLDDTRFTNSARSLVAADINRDGAPDLVASWGAILINQPADPNWAPTIDLSQSWADSNAVHLKVSVSDDDQDLLTYRWSASDGQYVPPVPSACVANWATPGSHTYTLTVDDGHGHQVTGSVTFSVADPDERGTITVTAPAAGEVVTAGQPYTIRWTSTPNLARETLWFSYTTDGWATSDHIWECMDTPVAAGQCVWNNPGPGSDNVYISMYTDDADIPGSGDTGRFTIRTAPGGVPWPWQNADIGAVASAGAASYANGAFTVRGSGADIWNAADEFHYAYQYVPSNGPGDIDVTARVDTLQDVNAWTKAGLMVRTSNAAGSTHASIVISPGKGIAFQRRTTFNGASVNTSGPLITAPVWLRLAVRGEKVLAYYKKNAADSWTKLGDQLFPPPKPWLKATFLYTGLAVTSHVDGTTASATFSNVAITPWQPQWTPTLVGSTVGSGAPAEDDDWYNLTNRGTDIWGTSDQFTFMNTKWDGNGTITSRVDTVDNTHAWAKAGVMFRNSLAPNAPHVMVVVTPGKGIAMQYRATAGAASATVAQAAGVTPVWVRVTRTGNTFTGAWSTTWYADASMWNTLGSVTVTMNGEIYTGMALTSHHPSATASARFYSPRVRP